MALLSHRPTVAAGGCQQLPEAVAAGYDSAESRTAVIGADYNPDVKDYERRMLLYFCEHTAELFSGYIDARRSVRRMVLLSQIDAESC